MSSSKIFGIGLSKTGTGTLHHALMLLGYRSIHLRHQSGERGGQIVEPEDFADYDAGTDINVAGRIAQLDERYPGSKWIYTVRELESWLASVHLELWANPEARGQQPGLRGLLHEPAMAAVIHEAFLTKPTESFVRSWWTREYVRHDNRVWRYFADRREDVLVLNVCGGDGWQPLCQFLGRPIPDEPFPHDHKGTYPWRRNGSKPPEGLFR